MGIRSPALTPAELSNLIAFIFTIYDELGWALTAGGVVTWRNLGP